MIKRADSRSCAAQRPRSSGNTSIKRESLMKFDHAAEPTLMLADNGFRKGIVGGTIKIEIRLREWLSLAFTVGPLRVIDNLLTQHRIQNS